MNAGPSKQSTFSLLNISGVVENCNDCITVCARDALKLAFGLGLGGKDLLRERSLPTRGGSL